MKNLITKDELAELATFSGSTLKFVTGFDVAVGLDSDLILISTSQGNLTLRGEIEIFDFEGFRNEFSTITVNRAPRETIEKVATESHRYLNQKNSVIEKILVQRAHYTHYASGIETWDYETDIALFFQTSKGHFRVVKNSIHTEVLIVDFSDHDLSLDEPDTADRFEEDLLESVSVAYSTLDIQELLGM